MFKSITLSFLLSGKLVLTQMSLERHEKLQDYICWGTLLCVHEQMKYGRHLSVSKADTSEHNTQFIQVFFFFCVTDSQFLFSYFTK